MSRRVLTLDQLPKKALRELLRPYVEAGAELVKTGGNHVAVRWGGRTFYLGGTPSDYRAMVNAELGLRRMFPELQKPLDEVKR